MNASFFQEIRHKKDLLVNAVRPDGVVDHVESVAGIKRGVKRSLVDRVVSSTLAVVLVAVGGLVVEVVRDAALSDPASVTEGRQSVHQQAAAESWSKTLTKSGTDRGCRTRPAS